jgi:hypothetical protein
VQNTVRQANDSVMQHNLLYSGSLILYYAVLKSSFVMWFVMHATREMKSIRKNKERDAYGLCNDLYVGLHLSIRAYIHTYILDGGKIVVFKMAAMNCVI